MTHQSHFRIELCYVLFYFKAVKAPAMQRKPESVEHGSSTHPKFHFNAVRDDRKHKVRGLWIRNGRYYAQMRVAGETSPRKVPLPEATNLTEAKVEMEKLRQKRRDRLLPARGRKPLLHDSSKQYLEYHRSLKRRLKKESTIKKEEGALDGWIGHFGSVRIDSITSPMISGYIEKRLKSVIPRTVALDILALQNLLKWERGRGNLNRLATEGLSFKDPHKAPKRELMTNADLQAIYDTIPKVCVKNGQEVYDYLRFLAFTGAREQEALRVRWDQDVDFTGQRVRIGGIEGDTKNSESRYVDFNENLEALLKDMKSRKVPDSVFLFPSPQRGAKDRPSKTLRSSFELVREKAGFPKLGFHDFRHYFISMAVMSGIDFMTIAGWVGHGDGGVLIGKVYGHLLPEHQKRMAGKLVFSPKLVDLKSAEVA